MIIGTTICQFKGNYRILLVNKELVNNVIMMAGKNKNS